MNFFNSGPIESLEVALAGLSLRQKNIGSNIANSEVPGYKKRNVNFEEELAKAQGKKEQDTIPLKSTDDKHFSISIAAISDVKPEVVKDPSLDIHSNGNNVDIDSEIVELGETGLKFTATANLAKRYFENMRNTIRG